MERSTISEEFCMEFWMRLVLNGILNGIGANLKLCQSTLQDSGFAVLQGQWGEKKLNQKSASSMESLHIGVD